MSTTYYDNSGREVPDTSPAIVLSKRVSGPLTIYQAKAKLDGKFFQREEIVYSKREPFVSVSEHTFKNLLKYYSEGGQHLFWKACNDQK